jgi:prepilin-type N-terminal cleavage/methylation domain-containing protein
MMFKMIRLTRRTQRGFTLIELVLALLISAIIAGGIIMSTSMVFTINALDSNHLKAVRQVDYAIDAITRDTLQAQTITVNGTGYFIDIQWTDFGTTTTHEIKYTIDAAGNLNRTIVGGTTRVVATNVTPATNCSLSGNVLTLNITAAITGNRPASETRQVQISRRPS